MKPLEAMKKIKCTKPRIDTKSPLLSYLSTPDCIPSNDILHDLTSQYSTASLLTPPSQLITALQNTMREIDNFPADHTTGLLSAKKAVISSLQTSLSNTCTLQPSDIFLGHSPRATLLQFLNCILNPGDNYLMPSPNPEAQILPGISSIKMVEKPYNVDFEGKFFGVY
jgi:aspartate/methionine/tyrosine aminotransferase